MIAAGVRWLAPAVLAIVPLVAVGPPAAAHEEPLTVTAGNGRVVISNAQPGCAVTVSAAGTEASATVGTTGVAVLDAPLPQGATVTARTGGGSCAAAQSSGIVDNDQHLAEAASISGTGADTAMGIVAGVGAVAMGTALVVAARRKKA